MARGTELENHLFATSKKITKEMTIHGWKRRRDLPAGEAHLPETIPCELQDFQGIVGPLAFAVEFNVAGETFQFYLSKREWVTAPNRPSLPCGPEQAFHHTSEGCTREGKLSRPILLSSSRPQDLETMKVMSLESVQTWPGPRKGCPTSGDLIAAA